MSGIEDIEKKVAEPEPATPKQRELLSELVDELAYSLEAASDIFASANTKEKAHKLIEELLEEKICLKARGLLPEKKSADVAVDWNELAAKVTDTRGKLERIRTELHSQVLKISAVLDDLQATSMVCDHEAEKGR